MARSRRRPRPPEGSFTARIDDLANDGRGLARLEGKAVFIHGGLPGEQVTFRYTARHSKYDEGRVESITEPSPQRVEPHCAHFDLCGGCALQHLEPNAQVAFKERQLLDNLARIGKVDPATVLPPLTGPHWGYRRKARLAVKDVPKKGRVLVGFRERGTPYVADLRRCEVLHPRVGGLLDALSALIGGLSLHARLPQIEVAVGDEAVALNFRVLDPPSAADRALLQDFGQRHDIQVYLQSKGPETTTLLWPEQGELNYRLPEFDLDLAFQPYHFTQVNTHINRPMVDRAVNLLAPQSHERVLDLFCGLGNFTLALARRAGEVVGVEGDASLVAWAGRNAERNGIGNAHFHAADLSAELGGQPWMEGPYHKALLDPPRSGALEMMPHLAGLGVGRIVYVSCHPATLARDVGELVNRHGYRLLAAGVMDMFPHTAHVESIALLESG